MMIAGVGVAIRVVCVSSIVVVGVAKSAVAVGDGSGADTLVGMIDTFESDSRVVTLTIDVVAVGTMVLMVGERSKFKSITTLPLEHITNILSTTLREGLVSAE